MYSTGTQQFGFGLAQLQLCFVVDAFGGSERCVRFLRRRQLLTGQRDLLSGGGALDVAFIEPFLCDAPTLFRLGANLIEPVKYPDPPLRHAGGGRSRPGCGVGRWRGCRRGPTTGPLRGRLVLLRGCGCW